MEVKMTRKEMFKELSEYYRINLKEFEKRIEYLNKYFDKTKLKNEKILDLIIDNCRYFPTVADIKKVVDETYKDIRGL